VRRLINIIALLTATALVGWLLKKAILRVRSSGPATIESRLKDFSASVEKRLRSDFQRAGVPYPPARLVFVGLKQEALLEVYAADIEPDSSLRFIRAYPIRQASGVLGPKLKEGDRQVPEGLYGIEYLNPNSAYHLSMKITYPNAFDKARGAEEGRTNLGGDIMIHGKELSIGCLAMGDEAAEDLFVLAALTGISNIKVILSPVDFRKTELPSNAKVPPWTATLYPQIRKALAALPAP
jgi:murein L,D-transpeptidase YafK